MSSGNAGSGPYQMSTQRLVIAGASLAGLRAAEAARERGFRGELILVGAEQHPPYDRTALSKAFLHPGSSAEPRSYRSSEYLLQRLDLTPRLGRAATGLDLEARELLVGGDRIGFDALIIATGAAPRSM